jgi:hypothetical protein
VFNDFKSCLLSQHLCLRSNDFKSSDLLVNTLGLLDDSSRLGQLIGFGSQGHRVTGEFKRRNRQEINREVKVSLDELIFPLSTSIGCWAAAEEE